MKYPIFGLVMAVVLAFALSAAGQTTQPTLFDPALHMRVSEVRSGMKGYGLTIFSGDDIVKFDVEVVSVLKNFNPKHDVILIRCPGEFLSHTGPIEGMSGSPIFLYPADDPDQKGTPRMAGAFAYGWAMSKDCLAGVQPIEYMLELPANTPATPPSTTQPAGASDAASASDGPAWSLIDLIRRTQPAGDVLPLDVRPARSADANQPKRDALTELPTDNPLLALLPATDDGPGFQSSLRPLATPLMTSGIPSSVMQSLLPAFQRYGLIPLQAAGSSGDTTQPAPTLRRGSVFVVPLLTGDADMTAVGTTTEVIGNRVFAFGHDFNNEGRISLPLGSGRIDGVIPTLNPTTGSFKMGNLSAITGTLLIDQTVGVAGRIGEAPTMIPLTVHTIYDDGTLDQVYHFQAAIHPVLTLAIVEEAIQSAITGSRGLPEHHTISFDATMDFANGRSLHIADRQSDSGASGVALAVVLPMAAASGNPYRQIMLKQLDATVHISDTTRRAEIVNVTVPRQTYHPGETIQALVTYRPYRGPEAVLPVEMPLPPSLPDGSYAFSVDDASHHLTDEMIIEPFRFTTHNIADVFAAAADKSAIRHDALYLRLVRTEDGVALGRVAMPQVPSSMRQVMLGDGRSDTVPFVSSDVRIVPTDWDFQGNADFHITVDRRFKPTTQP